MTTAPQQEHTQPHTIRAPASVAVQDTQPRPESRAQVRPASDAPKPTPIEMDERGLYRIANHHDEYRVAKMLIDTKAVPQSFRTPEQVMMAIQALKSLGLNWRTALRQCSFSAQGAFTVFGDLELAVVRASGVLQRFEEYLVVQDEDGKLARRCMANNNILQPVVAAVCVIKRKDMPDEHEAIFTVEDAKQAGLWGKTPTWSRYASRMLCMRARGLALRNVCSDITQGLAGQEYDVEGVDYGKAHQ